MTFLEIYPRRVCYALALMKLSHGDHSRVPKLAGNGLLLTTCILLLSPDEETMTLFEATVWWCRRWWRRRGCWTR